MNDTERSMARRFIPFTRMVSEANTKYQGEPVHLPTFIDQNKDQLVLKPSAGMQAQDVIMGNATDTHTWQENLAKAMNSGQWVVQELVKSRQYYYLSEGQVVPHNMIWGPFVYNQTYGGCFLRAQPTLKTGPICMTNLATESYVLEVDR